MVDPATGKVLGSPERMSERFLGSNSAPAWSPDGRHLAYLSQRGPASERPGSQTVVIRSVDSGEERDLATRLNLSAPIQWFPDGLSLLVPAQDNNWRWCFYRVDAQSGSAVLIRQSATLGGPPSPALSPDGKAIFCTRSDLKAQIASLLVHGIKDGRDKQLYRVVLPAVFDGLAVSRDGRQLAFAVPDHGLYVMPAAGGEGREILRAAAVGGPGRIAWTPDGHHVLAVRPTGSPSARNELWRVPLAGGEPRKIDLPGGVAFPSVHPDGRRFAYTGGRAGQSEVWVLENFLTALR